MFALGGNVQHTGLVEVPIGMQLGELIYEIGGGIPNGKTYKAAQLGGPSGGCIPKEHLNVPVDYETLQELGAIMGSGGLIVMDEDTCMVDIARFFLEFTQEESCGKCPPCRVGTKRMLEIVERICHGEGEEGDIERLIALGETISQTALCGLGQTAPNPVLSTIRHFRHEYEAHIKDKYCEAGVCSTMFKARCSNACPASVNIPGFVSLVGEQRYDEALKLHRERNPLASICARVCFHPCESKCMRASLDGAARHPSRQALHGRAGDGRRSCRRSWRTPRTPRARSPSSAPGRPASPRAYFLARLGYKPVVFEAEPKAGGMLVQAIPAYRLPRPELEREVRMIEAMGASFEYGKALGKDFTLQSLKDEGYEAVFVAVGAPQGTGIGIPGEDGPGVYDGLSFLKEYNVSGKGEVGKNVAVIGGGNAAIDAARTALRLGAESVKILYRRTRAQMPAWGEEIDAADLEGIEHHDARRPGGDPPRRERQGHRRALQGDGAGRLRPQRPSPSRGRPQPRLRGRGRHRHRRHRAEARRAGRPRRHPRRAQPLGLPRRRPEHRPDLGRLGVHRRRRRHRPVVGGRGHRRRREGRRRHGRAPDRRQPRLLAPRHRAADVLRPRRRPRAGRPSRGSRSWPVAGRVTNFDEVELGWAAEVAIAEAKRCLRCDYGKYCS